MPSDHHPGSLLHVMGDDDDGVPLLELADQVSMAMVEIVQRGAGLSIANTSGCTAIARATHTVPLPPPDNPPPGFIQSILTRPTSLRRAQRGDSAVSSSTLRLRTPCSFRAGNHIVANRHGGEWIFWPLKYLHPDCPADTDRADTGGVDILIIEQYGTLTPSPG